MIETLTEIIHTPGGALGYFTGKAAVVARAYAADLPPREGDYAVPVPAELVALNLTAADARAAEALGLKVHRFPNPVEFTHGQGAVHATQVVSLLIIQDGQVAHAWYNLRDELELAKHEHPDGGWSASLDGHFAARTFTSVHGAEILHQQHRRHGKVLGPVQVISPVGREHHIVRTPGDHERHYTSRDAALKAHPGCEPQCHKHTGKVLHKLEPVEHAKQQ